MRGRSGYTPRRERIAFAPGERVQRVAVRVVGDTRAEAHEAFSVRLARARGARLGRARAHATIVEDDAGAPPHANPGPDLEVNAVERARLDGRGSADPEGGPLTFAWSFASRPPGSTASLLRPRSARPAFDPDVPGTYVVRLVVGDGVSRGAPATVAVAARSQVVRFVAVGDTGKGNADQYAVAGAMRAKCAASGCDFVVGLGDNIYESGATSVDDVQFVQKFQLPYAGIALPFWMLLGNHDHAATWTGLDPARAQVQVDYTSAAANTGGKWRMPAHSYRRSHEHVEFFTLDTTPLMYAPQPVQASALASWLGRSRAYWKIALGHHPYRSNGPHGNAGSYDGIPVFAPPANGVHVRDFLRTNVCSRAHLYLAGHDHNLQWLREDPADCAGTELVVSGAGGATIRGLPGTNPSHFGAATHGFAYVVVRDRRLTVEFVDRNGVSLYTRTTAR